MTENLDKLPAITNLSKKEKTILNDNLVKFHIISNVLDCLVGCPVRCSEKQMLKSPVKLLI